MTPKEKAEIAEEFAMEFADWMRKFIYDNTKLYFSHSTKELLEIYKKEQANKCEYCGLENGNHKLSCPVIKVTIII